MTHYRFSFNPVDFWSSLAKFITSSLKSFQKAKKLFDANKNLN